MGIATVAVYSDADAGAPFVGEADVAVRLPGVTPAETYLRGDLVVAAALRAGADAVHPGYGFLSENAGFARAVLDAGLVWVGPPPAAIEAMGVKLAAKELMRTAGVPTLPWATDPAGGGTRSASRCSSRLPPAAAAAACAIVRDRRRARRRGRGRAPRGGGRRSATAPSSSSATSSAPRHVEVQVFGDPHGNVVSLFERECSIQRRHQKVVEEAPSPAVDAGLRDADGGGRGRRRARPSATSARARSSSCSTPTAELLPGDEHPAAGRASRSPSWSPDSTWCGCSCSSPPGEPLPSEAAARVA